MAGVSALMSHGDAAAKWRKEQGDYLTRLRVEAGLTQAEMAKALGYAWPSVVGSHEQGKSNLPPERYVDFATAVHIEPKEFVKTILRWQNPWAYAVLWGSETPPRGVTKGTPTKGAHAAPGNRLPHSKAPRKRG